MSLPSSPTPAPRLDTSTPTSVWVFHAGALGDFVLTWPLLRALARSLPMGQSLALVADPAKAHLAARLLGPPGILPVDANQRRFTRLWTGEPPAAVDVTLGASRVLTFLADESTEPGRRWLAAAAGMFPGAAIGSIGPAGDPSRTVVWSRHRASELGAVEPRLNPGGPIVVHVGAGTRDKMWPLERWADVVDRLQRRADVVVLAGEAEAERFDQAQQSVLRSMRARTLLRLDDLADALLEARLFIGADTGPTHLAAQFGLPTLALFGPTDPAVWSPVGPVVTVLAAPDRSPGSMHRLAVQPVEAAALGLLSADR
jgi:heptosyltransferase-3